MKKEENEIKDLEQSIRNLVGNHDGYSAPPDFFENFEKKMLHNIKQEPKKTLVIPMWKKPIFQVAAAITLLIGLFSIYLTLNNSTPAPTVYVSNEIELKSDQEFEEAYEFLAANEAFIYENLSSKELEKIETEESWLNNENDIENYLELHESEFSNILDDEELY